MTKLPKLQYELLILLSKREVINIEEVIDILKEDQANIMAAAQMFQQKNWVKIEEKKYYEYKIGSKGKEYNRAKLPERIILESIIDKGEEYIEISQLSEKSGLEKQWAGEAIKWLTDRGWFKKEGSKLILENKGKESRKDFDKDDKLWDLIFSKQEGITEEELKQNDFVDALNIFQSKRKRFIEDKERKQRIFTLLEQGKSEISKGIAPVTLVTVLNSELIQEGKWSEIEFQPYDVTLPSQPVYPGKIHPFKRICEQIRQTFLRMGFEEITSPCGDVSFWDFDALFQPQDHPARDMQDTFYLAQPSKANLPEGDVVEKVKKTHENGGDTGSTGWGYNWNYDLAKSMVLRTHNTAATVRALFRHPEPPLKVFCIGPVFRRETVTYKHLPVFHQVDGIIIDEKANIRTLMGTLKAFYKQMGFDNIQFRPSFYPYTEPSLDVYVWYEKRKDWVEMGGSGIFRPEVTEPMGSKHPVLAWGLGIERLAMFIYNLDKIGDLYQSDISWLKETPQCLR